MFVPYFQTWIWMMDDLDASLYDIYIRRVYSVAVHIIGYSVARLHGASQLATPPCQARRKAH